MKSIILLCLLLPHAAVAQQPAKKLSFYVQGGYRSSAYFKEAGHKDIVSATETRHHLCIILNAGLQWDINEKWRIGPSFTYDHFGTKRRSLEFSNLSYMLRLDRTWTKSNNWSFYSGAALGAHKVRKFKDEKETDRRTVLGFQVYLAGAELKVLKHLALDMNIGWGATGLAGIGAKYRF